MSVFCQCGFYSYHIEHQISRFKSSETKPPEALRSPLTVDWACENFQSNNLVELGEHYVVNSVHLPFIRVSDAGQARPLTLQLCRSLIRICMPIKVERKIIMTAHLEK